MNHQSRLSPVLWYRVILAAFVHVSNTNLSLIAAGVGFYAMLSLFPALAALIAIWGIISDPAVVLAQLEEIRAFLPSDVYDIINTQIVTLVTARADTLGWASIASLLVALWSARAGVGAMMIGLNSAYDERNRNTAKHYFRALLLTLALIGVGIVALLTVVVAPIALSFVPLGPFEAWIAELIRWSIAVTVLLGGVGVLYRFGPNRRAPRIGWLTPGAVVAVLLWAVLSIGFSYYVANFGTYNKVYGSIGAVMAMLVWLWISSFLVLLGAAINAQLELRMQRDTTVGRSKPMGERGAFVADNLVEDD